MTITQASAQSADEVETERLRAVERYAILDTPTDDAFDRIARLAARCLGTTMAAVSLVDRDRVWFKAGYGLGATQQIDRRLALCEPAIRDGKVVVITDTHDAPDAVGNPNVQRWNIRFFAAAPIVTSDGHRIGTVNVLDTEAHHPAADDIAMLTDLAAIVMDELELRLTALSNPGETETTSGSWDPADTADEDQTTIVDYAAALQRSLLPPSLPNIPGITLAAHYHPASAAQVGGDFYDVFALDQRRWAFFLGDVEGHGTTAASVTSLVRYTLRAAALHHDEPTDGLAELNNVLVGDPNEKKFCTVLFGMLTAGTEPGTHRVRLATGGHPPALLLDAAGQVRRIRPESGMLVGAISDATFDQCTIDLRPGQTLLLYTDGITEARPSGAECFGEEALIAFVAERVGMPAPELVGELAALVHSLHPDDDVALLALTADPDRGPLG